MFDINADGYAHGAGGAAMRKINSRMGLVGRPCVKLSTGLDLEEQLCAEQKQAGCFGAIR